MTPSPNNLLTALRVLFSIQSKEIEQQILKGDLSDLDLTHWIQRMVKIISPILQDYYAHGMRRTAVQLGIEAMSGVDLRSMMDLMRERASEDGGRSHVIELVPKKTVALVVAKAVRRSVDAVLHRGRSRTGFNPRVIDAIDQAALHFCRETLDTATTDANSAIEQTRIGLKRHLRYATRYGPRAERGEYQHILRSLTRSISRIFNDPYRALRIANTEYHRAIHAGDVLEAKAAPFRTIKVWRAPVGSCKECRKLNGVKRGLDEPFIVLQQSGPYSQIMYPPYHPNCDCTMSIRKAS